MERLIVLARHKYRILAITAVAAITGLLVSFLIPNSYKSEVSILPPQQNQSSAAMMISQLASSGAGSLAAVAGKDLGLRSPSDVFIGMMKSRLVADSLIERFDLVQAYHAKRPSDARKDLKDATDISMTKEGLLTVTVEDHDAKRAAAIANAYVEELHKLTQNLAITEASQRRLFFQQQLQRAKDDLAAAEVQLKDLQQRTGMIQLDSQAKATIEQIGMMRAQIAAKEVQLQAMRSFATEQNPDYVVIQQEVAGLKTQLAKMENQQSDREGDPLVTTSKIPGVAMEYVRQLREVKYREAVFELFAKQFEAAKIDEAKQAALIQVVDPAIPADRKSAPKRAIITLIVALVAMIVTTAWYVCKEQFSGINVDPVRLEQIRVLRAALGLD